MGIVINSVADCFSFARKYPSAFVLYLIQAMISLIFELALLGLLGLGFTGTPSIPRTLDIASFFLVLIIFIIVELISLSLIYGATPILIRQGSEQRKISISSAVKAAWKNLLRIIGLEFILGVIAFAIALVMIIPIVMLSVSFFYGGIVLFIIGAVVFVGALVALIYVMSRLSLSMTLLMIANKRVGESIDSSWKLMDGKVLRFFAANLLMLIALIPLELLYILPQFLFPTDFIIISLTSLIYSTIAGLLLGIFPTVFYYNLKGSK